ncbi:hypothetical protein D3C72_2339180 [compost metagenome]
MFNGASVNSVIVTSLDLYPTYCAIRVNGSFSAVSIVKLPLESAVALYFVPFKTILAPAKGEFWSSVMDPFTAVCANVEEKMNNSAIVEIVLM